MRHADATRVTVELNVTSNLVRLSVENDGVRSKIGGIGIGLRNLRQRTAAVGGNISIDSGALFRMVCVIPI